jgi:hypothetical protein
LTSETQKCLTERFSLGNMVFARRYASKNLPRPLFKKEGKKPLFWHRRVRVDFMVRQAGAGHPHLAFPDEVCDVDKQTDLGIR